ncbi:MAG: CpaF family protein [Hyphomicrobiales bacterium]
MKLRLLDIHGKLLREFFLKQESYEIGNDMRRASEATYIAIDSAASRPRHARLARAAQPGTWKLTIVSSAMARMGSIKLSVGEEIPSLVAGREFRLGDVTFHLVPLTGEIGEPVAEPSLAEVEGMLNSRLAAYQDENRDLFGPGSDRQAILSASLEDFIEEKLADLPIDLLEAFCGEALKRIMISACLLTRPDEDEKRDVQRNFSRLIQDSNSEVLDLRAQLTDALSLSMVDTSTAKDLGLIENGFTEAYARVGPLIGRVLMLEIIRDAIREEVLGLFFKLGPLQFLLDIDKITEIMICAHDTIFIEKATGDGSQMINTGLKFASEDELLNIMRRIASQDNKQLTIGEPLVDARLEDGGSRVNIVINPIAKKGSALTIRKFSDKQFEVKDLVEKKKSLSFPMARFLEACVIARKNIIVSGGTGTGKTTLLNTLSSFIPDGDRVVTIEDTAELRLTVENLVSLEARRATSDGTGEVTIKDLLKNALRMRPDRIVVGECRGGETLDMLQAMNTGHDGSMTTAHANTPLDLVLRLETMVLQGGQDMPVTAIRQQIAAAVDVIVQIERVGGRRIVREIAEVGSFDQETGEIPILPIFEFVETLEDGRFDISGYAPSFFEDLTIKGKLDEATFLS